MVERVVADRAVDVLVILDGASEPLGSAPTSLERARTPVLDRLAAEGLVTSIRTVPPGLPAGSEAAIPGLLGWAPDEPVDRGAVEAAAYGIEVGDKERAWRVDRRDRCDAAATARVLARALERLPRRRGARRQRVHHLAGHRMLIVGPDPAPTLAGELLGIELSAGLLGAGPLGAALGARAFGSKPLGAGVLGAELLVWPAGVIPPRVLDRDTVVIGARGAAIGIARLMGARTIVPPGATGKPGSDLAAKAVAALAAIDGDGGGRVAGDDGGCIAGGSGIVSRVVVHVGAPDEAAHERDADAKVAAIEAADALVLAPLADALRACGGTLRVCPDHGCDPATGEHDDAPVPCLDWPAAHASAPAHASAQTHTPGGRLTERMAAERLTEAAVTGHAVTAHQTRPVVAA